MQITLSGPGDEETQKLVAEKKKFLGAWFEKENRERKLNEVENYGGIEESFPLHLESRGKFLEVS